MRIGTPPMKTADFVGFVNETRKKLDRYEESWNEWTKEDIKRVKSYFEEITLYALFETYFWFFKNGDKPKAVLFDSSAAAHEYAARKPDKGFRVLNYKEFIQSVGEGWNDIDKFHTIDQKYVVFGFDNFILGG